MIYLYRESKITPIVEVIKINQLKWYGHVMRRDDDSVVKVALSIQITGKRPRGSLRLRWINNTSGHLEGKRPRGRPRLRWINNTSFHLEGKRPRGRPRLRWINNTSGHLERKNPSLKDVTHAQEPYRMETVDF